MRKILILLFLWSAQTFAQTFPVNNLSVSGNAIVAGSTTTGTLSSGTTTISGTSTLNGPISAVGQATFTLSPTAPTPTLGDNSTKLATTAFVQGSIGSQANPFTVGTSLYPFVAGAINTTATTTSGSTSITVTSAAGLQVGMGIYAGFVTTCSKPSGAFVNPYITAIAGTTITMSCSATATNASPVAVQFGQNRWDANSTLLVNDIGTQTLKVGSSAQGNTNGWLNQISSGEDFRLTSAATIIAPPGGGNALTVASRTSDATGGESALPLNIFLYADTWGGPTFQWAEYIQSNLSAATAGSNEHLQVEQSINSLWPTVSEDPYSQNQTNSTIGNRTDCGTGNPGLVNNCTAAYEITNNGAQFESGINIGSTAIDTGGGTRAGNAIQLPLQNQVIWYSAASTYSAAFNSPSAGIMQLNVPSGGQFQTIVNGVNEFSVLGNLTFTHPTAFATATAGVTCNSGSEGFEASITDGNTAVFNATVAGGGSNHIKMRCNGSNWVVY